MTYNEMTHYVDRQFGGVMYIRVVDNAIVAMDDDEYNGKMFAKLKGMSVEEAQRYFKTKFKGVFMQIKPK